MSHIEYSGGQSRFHFDKKTSALAIAKSLRDRLIECWNDTMQQWTIADVKRVYVISPTFSLGKRIRAVLVNLNLEDAYREALADLGIKIEEIYDYEVEEASTKKGQWTHSLIESLATLDLPSWGYGIRTNFSHYTAEQKQG